MKKCGKAMTKAQQALDHLNKKQEFIFGQYIFTGICVWDPVVDGNTDLRLAFDG